MKNLFLSAVAVLMLSACATKPVEPVVRIETSMGNVKVVLYNDTPIHRDNFLKLVDEHFYDGILFHRVINNFMDQFGDPDSKTAAPGAPLGESDAGYTLPAEILPHHIHKRGAMNAARQGNDVNPERESSGSQFCLFMGRQFDDDAQLDSVVNKVNSSWRKDCPLVLTDEQREIYKTLGGSPHLDGEYTVFGEIIEGQDVVDAIAGVPTDSLDRPVSDVRIITMVRER
ncbi:MAG: peptidylprolyl isomerase [Bacteroidales bacterium]|nr:peptidylprolyl isomerase [Bacteroidales bacterium]